MEPSHFAAALAGGRQAKVLACVHAETSTGVETPLKPIAEIAHAHGALFVADAVTSLGGIAVDIDNSGVDACYSGTQKCVGAPPGIAPITVSDQAIAVAEQRKSSVANWYYDWSLLRKYYDAPHAYHHTVPVNMLFAADEALREILDEGLVERYNRHRRVSELLLEGLRSLGIKPFAPEECRLPTLNAVTIPDSVADEVEVRRRLLAEYGIEIGGGLGALKGRIWRIGTMGASATERNVLLLIAALWKVLPR